MKIRLAQLADNELLEKYDRHIGKEILKKQIDDQRIMIAEEDEIFIGWLRYNLFWDNIPFMNMLFFLEEYRGKGYGKKLVLEWEKEMKSQGYKVVMTSTQANEWSQHFYRRLGYFDVGGFTPPGEPYELVLMKNI